MFGKWFGRRSPQPGKNRLSVVVARKRKVAETIWELVLRHPEGADLPAWQAGAHIDLVLEKDAIRQYSLAGDPAIRDSYRTAVLLEPESRGGSRRICNDIAEGDELVISEPRNHFPLDAEAPFSLLVAGGIGITPLLAMGHELHQAGRPFALCYRARSRSWAAYADELPTLPWGGQVETYFSDEGGREAFDLEKRLHELPLGTHLYVCGPNGFIERIENLSVPVLGESAVHSEKFYPEAHDKSGDHAFELVCQKSGITLQVPANRTMVEVLDEAGIDVPTSCEDGICGSCISQVIEGEVEHRDEVLSRSDRENRGLFTPCCSRAKGDRLVVDL